MRQNSQAKTKQLLTQRAQLTRSVPHVLHHGDTGWSSPTELVDIIDLPRGIGRFETRL